MGLFESMKEGLQKELQGSGVKLHINAPNQASIDQPSIMVEVQVEALQEPRTVTQLKVVMTEQEEEPMDDLQQGQMFNNQNQMYNNQDQMFNNQGRIVQVYPTPIPLHPGQPIPINFELPLAGSALAGAFGNSKVGEVLGFLSEATQSMNQMEKQYFIHATAMVDGQNQKAHASHSVTVYPQGGFGIRL